MTPRRLVVLAYLAAALAILLLVPTKGAAQAAPPPGFLAVTRCASGIPVTVIDPMLDSITAMEIGAHEAAHRRQLAGDCDARLAAIMADPHLRLEAEAEGYCAGLAALGLNDQAHRLATQRMALLVASVFEMVGRDEVVDAITRFCARPPT